MNHYGEFLLNFNSLDCSNSSNLLRYTYFRPALLFEPGLQAVREYNERFIPRISTEHRFNRRRIKHLVVKCCNCLKDLFFS